MSNNKKVAAKGEIALKILDLCSGTGGATKSFSDRGHEVILVDISQGLGKPTIQADIKYLPIRKTHFDFIWFSPPCNQFSMRSARAKGKEPKLYSLHGEPDLSILRAGIEIIKEFDPTFWIIENVSESRQFFEPILGPASHWGSWYWWGRIPFLMIDPGQPRKGLGTEFLLTNKNKHKGSKKWKGGIRERPGAMSVHPSISLSLCRAMEIAK